MIILCGKGMLRVIETFSGLGAQAKALERIGVEHSIVNTCDWDIGAIIAYYLIHKDGESVKKYKGVTDAEVNEFLKSKTLSITGKKPMNEKTLNKMSLAVKRLLYAAIKESNNLVSITDVKGMYIPENIDLLTYSFPCQDLSMCGYWHGNKSGISREAHNRSGMLWEVERILQEMSEQGIKLPHFLVMENVTNILSATHKADFDDWKSTLESLGYYNKIYRLNAKNFGVPQKRERAYMISILCNQDIEKIMHVCKYFEENDLQDIKVATRYTEREFKLKDVLRLDYSIKAYREEADAGQPNDTPSREKILHDNDMLFDGESINEVYVNTVTTKQDRNPNSGLVYYDNGLPGKTKWRYLTPRECFMLMGFDERDFDAIVQNNCECLPGKMLFSNEKLIKLAGNSICVDVLEAIFKQIIEINGVVFA